MRRYYGLVVLLSLFWVADQALAAPVLTGIDVLERQDFLALRTACRAASRTFAPGPGGPTKAEWTGLAGGRSTCLAGMQPKRVPGLTVMTLFSPGARHERDSRYGAPQRWTEYVYRQRPRWRHRLAHRQLSSVTAMPSAARSRNNFAHWMRWSSICRMWASASIPTKPWWWYFLEGAAHTDTGYRGARPAKPDQRGNDTRADVASGPELCQLHAAAGTPRDDTGGTGNLLHCRKAFAIQAHRGAHGELASRGVVRSNRSQVDQTRRRTCVAWRPLHSTPASACWKRATSAWGRGTDAPFERLGAPWIDDRELAGALNARHIPGVRFRQGKVCSFGRVFYIRGNFARVSGCW